MNGVSCVNSASFTLSRPSANTNRLWFGIFTTLWTTASVPTLYRSVGCGVSTRASRCATTTMVLSSPSELISWTELSRPTVSGSTACGKRTVSRTGKTGSERLSGDIFSLCFCELYYFPQFTSCATALKPNLSVWYSSFDAGNLAEIHLGHKCASYESIWILNPHTTLAKKRMFTEPLGAINWGGLIRPRDRRQELSPCRLQPAAAATRRVPTCRLRA